MKIVIELPEDFYWRMKYQNGMSVSEAEVVVNAFYNSLIVSDELHILTKEAYSDLCLRASEKSPCALCQWHKVGEDTYCWECNARPIEEGAEE